MNDLTLLIDGVDYAGWTDVRVTRGIERAAADFRVSLTERWPGRSEPWRIERGNPCQVLLDDEPVITGFVDSTAPSFDARSHRVSVAGRSRTADLVDSSAIVSGGQFKGLKLLDVARELLKPFQSEVLAEAETGPALDDVQVQQGETVFALIERLCRQQALLLHDDEAGNLVLTRTGLDHSGGALRQGENILSASATLSDARRHSLYEVKGQQAGNDKRSGAAANEVSAKAFDEDIERYRPLLIVAEGQVDEERAKARADWEARRRRGQATSASVTVQGWRQRGDHGPLWKVNRLVTVESDWLGLDHELLVSEIEYSKGASGTLTRLSVAPPSAFTPEPTGEMPPPRTAKGGLWI